MTKLPYFEKEEFDVLVQDVFLELVDRTPGEIADSSGLSRTHVYDVLSKRHKSTSLHTIFTILDACEIGFVEFARSLEKKVSEYP